MSGDESLTALSGLSLDDVRVDQLGRVEITNPEVAKLIASSTAKPRPRPVPNDVCPSNTAMGCGSTNIVAGCGTTNTVAGCGKVAAK